MTHRIKTAGVGGIDLKSGEDLPNLTGKSLKVVILHAGTSSSISLQHQLPEELPSRQKRKDYSLGKKMISSKQKTTDLQTDMASLDTQRMTSW